MPQSVASSVLEPIPYLSQPAVCKRFDNGYQLIFVPKAGGVFNVNTWVNTGSIHEDDQNNGVSHFLEHLLFKGTERCAPGEFDKAMEGMGAVINAATWKDFTFYYVTGPNDAEKKNFLKALDLHADMLLFSTVPIAELGEQYDHKTADESVNKRERGVVIEEMGMRGDQPWTKVFNALTDMMYPEGHPYRPDVIGTPEIISQIPREEIMKYYYRWYSPAALTTVVVGDFDAEWLEKEVLKAFNFEQSPAMTAGDKPEVRQITDEDDLLAFEPENRWATQTTDLATAFMMIGFHGPYAKDLKASVAIDVLSMVLGEGRSSRLYQRFIEQPDVPVFNALSSGQSRYRLGNVLYVQGNLNCQTQEEAQAQSKLILAELEKMLGPEPVTEEELARAKKSLKVNFAETSESAAGLAEELGESIILTGSIGRYTQYLDILETITLADINAVLTQWINPDKAFTSVLLPKSE